MLAPEPRLARNISREVSFLSQSAASWGSSSGGGLPMHRSVADLSLRWGGLGSGVDAHVVFRESRAFLGRVILS